MPDIFTASGAKVYISPASATEPATATAYAALTWTEVGLVESIGEYGDSASSVTFAALGDARIRKGKGSRNAGALSITCGYAADDVGQIAMAAAEATNSNFCFKIELPNKKTPVTGLNEMNYFRGLVMSKPKNIGSNDTVVRRTFNVEINSAITSVDPT